MTSSGDGALQEALRADPAKQPLGEHQLEAGGQQVGLDAHVDESVEGLDDAVGVQGRQDQVTGQRRLDRDP